MSFRIDLQQLLDIALATPEIGNVNFNVLRGFLLEVLKHLGIRSKIVLVKEEEEDLRAAYDLIREGFVIPQVGAASSELELIDEHVMFEESGGSRRAPTPVLRQSATPQEMLERAESSRRTKSATPRLSQGKMSPSRDGSPVPQGRRSRTPQIDATDESDEKSVTSEGLPQSKDEESDKKSVRSDGSASSKKSAHSPAGISLTVTPAASPTHGIAPEYVPSSKISIDSTRRSTDVLHRGETMKSLIRKMSELQTRVETLETTKVVSSVKSTASLFIHSDSKTPAKDMTELISFEQKLKGCETTAQGLAEIVDILTADFHELAETVKNESQKMESIQIFLADVDTKSKGDRDELLKQMEEMKSELKQTIEEAQFKPTRKPSLDVSHVERVVDRKLQHEINQLAQQFASNQGDSPITISNEPPKELYEALDKIDDLYEIQQTSEEQIKTISEDIVNLKEVTASVDSERLKALVNEQESLRKTVEKSQQSAGQASSTALRLDLENKKINSSIEENKRQIVQLNNNLMEFKNQFEELSSTVQGLMADEHRSPVRGRVSHDGEDISLIRNMINDLKEEKDELKKSNQFLLQELQKKQRLLSELQEKLEQIQLVKADKDYITNEMKAKADKREINLKVERDDFDRYIGMVDQSLRDLLQRLEGHENVLRETIDSISNNVNTKLDRAEVEPLKHYLEERLKALKPRPVEMQHPTDDYAAGFRKVLIKNFNCISCDRPVEFARERMFPPLPSAQALPNKKSNRPYTTFELDQIRQHMIRGGMEMEQERFEALDNRRRKLQSEILKLSGTPNIEDLADVIERPCGGSHTLSYPHSPNVVRGLNLNREEFVFETMKSLKPLQTVDIMGQDGHIYKGLVDDITSVLPQITTNSTTPNKATPKTLKEQNRSTPCRCATPSPVMFGQDGIDDDSSS